ncbi:MAG: transposase, partial [Myxococcales bacterium]|nr:transposase [Myxococcales bacterium]
YDGASDTYRCPAGHTLGFEVQRTRTSPTGKVQTLRTYGGAPCQECPRAAECTTSKTKGRTIVRSGGAEFVEGMRHVMSYPHSIREYRQRAAMVEPVFADLKQNQHFTRLRRTGARVRLEVAMHLAAHNLGRYLRLLHSSELADALVLAIWATWAALRSWLAGPRVGRKRLLCVRA